MLSSVISLSVIGFISATVLFIAAKKFKIFEDHRISEIEQLLPNANCGGCGFAGCRNFAEAVVNAGKMEGLNCPVADSEVMSQVGKVIGIDVIEAAPLIVVLRCNGTRANAVAKVKYDGAANCGVAHSLFAGESGCPSGCLGLGDCEVVCNFNALYIDKISGQPVVSEDKCVACGACVKACPRNLYELRPKGDGGKRVYVACMNNQKGALAKKNCSVACIGCMKCVKLVDGKSVNVTNYLSYIGTDVDVNNCGPSLIGCCPTGAIVGVRVKSTKDDKSESGV